MYRTLESLRPRFEESGYWGRYYRERMACTGTGEYGHPKNSGSWAHDPEIYALATFLQTTIVMGIYRRDGSIGWLSFPPITRGFSIMNPDLSLENEPAIYILHTASGPNPTPTGPKPDHFRVMMGLRQPSGIPGLDSSTSVTSPAAARKSLTKPSTPTVSIC